jgi:hypothetical protein
MRRLIPLAIVLALGATACGDDTPSADPALVSGLRRQISASQQGSGPLEMTDDEIECFAIGIIDLFGAERITASLDLEFSEFMSTATPGERRTVVDTMFDCADLGPALAAELAGGGDISADSARCLADSLLASEAFRDATAESFASSSDPFDDPELVGELLPVMLQCLSAEDLAELGG